MSPRKTPPPRLRIALTGVPGCGKTTIAHALAHRGVGIVDLNAFAEGVGLLGPPDPCRGSRIVDTVKLARSLDRATRDIEEPLVLEGHFAHEMHVDKIVLLRCDPLVLVERLRARGWREEKVRENVEAEALDVLAHDVATSGIPAREVDVTALSVDEAADAVWAIAEGRPKGFKGRSVGSAAWRLESLPWS